MIGPALGKRAPTFGHEVNSRHIDGRGLLDEGVLARLDGRLQVDRLEMGRSRQDHVVDLGNFQQPVVSVKASEAPVPGDIDTELGEFATCAVQPVLEQVGQGNDLDVTQ